MQVHKYILFYGLVIKSFVFFIGLIYRCIYILLSNSIWFCILSNYYWFCLLRGESHNQEEPLECFSRVEELRSLCPATPVLALTATASPNNRRKIKKNLGFKMNSCLIVTVQTEIKLKFLKKSQKHFWSGGQFRLYI